MNTVQILGIALAALGILLAVGVVQLSVVSTVGKPEHYMYVGPYVYNGRVVPHSYRVEAVMPRYRGDPYRGTGTYLELFTGRGYTPVGPGEQYSEVFPRYSWEKPPRSVGAVKRVDGQPVLRVRFRVEWDQYGKPVFHAYLEKLAGDKWSPTVVESAYIGKARKWVVDLDALLTTPVDELFAATRTATTTATTTAAQPTTTTINVEDVVKPADQPQNNTSLGLGLTVLGVIVYLWGGRRAP